MTQDEQRKALEWVDRRIAKHQMVPYDMRGEGYPEIFGILETIKRALSSPAAQAERVSVEEFCQTHPCEVGSPWHMSGEIWAGRIARNYPNGLIILPPSDKGGA